MSCFYGLPGEIQQVASPISSLVGQSASPTAEIRRLNVVIFQKSIERSTRQLRLQSRFFAVTGMAFEQTLKILPLEPREMLVTQLEKRSSEFSLSRAGCRDERDGQVFRLNLVVVGKRERSTNHVLQLTHVARPVVPG